MSKIGGTQINLGIGIEATAGTAVASTVFPKWSDFSVQAIAEKSHFTPARGKRVESSDSMIRRRYSQGQLSVVPKVDIAPYLFGLALGSVSSADSGDASGDVYAHTITVQNANASMKSATLIVENGGEVTERMTNVVANALNLEVSDDYAKLTADLIGGFPDTSSLTESYTQETEFAYHQMAVKFGTSLSNAAGNAATPLKSFNLNINNNVQTDEAFLSGTNTPVAGGFVAGRLSLTGSYSLQFDGTTELNKYKANTKNACIVTFTGAGIGTSDFEDIVVNLGKLILTSPPKEYNIDGLIILNQEFTVEFDATDNEISVVVTNLEDGTEY